mgnify:CR=1 FL=1
MPLFVVAVCPVLAEATAGRRRNLEAAADRNLG